MSITLNPPPLQIPPDFMQDEFKRGFFGGLINTLYQIWTALYGIRLNVKVKTTDNTSTGIIRIPVPAGKTVMIQATVVARRTGGVSGSDGDSAWYQLTGAYKNIAGVLTGIGTPNLIGGEDQSGWDLVFSTSSQDAVVAVVGAVGNDITWEGMVSTYTVGA